ncbi:MAG: hypothetical protein ACRDZO_25700 [Egibacteraceae bacterium]
MPMGPQTWIGLRWPLVMLGMALVVAMTVPAAVRAILGSVQFRDGDGLEAVEASPASDLVALGPVSDGFVGPMIDFVARGGTVTASTAPDLVLGDQPGSAVVLAFPAIPGNPTCIGDVSLELTVAQATPTHIGVFGATVWQAAILVDGSPLPSHFLVDDEPSRHTGIDDVPGRLRWNVTSAYRTFLTSGEAPAGAPFVAAVTATSAVDPGGGVRFFAAESGENSPVLTWTGVPGC